MLRLSPRQIAALGIASLVLAAGAACGHKAPPMSGSNRKPVAAVPQQGDSAPGSLKNDNTPTDAPSPAPSASISPSPAKKAATAPALKPVLIDLTGAGQNGVVTADDTITCVGEPISGIWIDGPGGQNSDPLGDQNIGDNRASSIELRHDIPAGLGTYKLSFGCGYRGAVGDHEWLYRNEGLPTVPATTNHTFVCNRDKGCTVDGRKVS